MESYKIKVLVILFKILFKMFKSEQLNFNDIQRVKEELLLVAE